MLENVLDKIESDAFMYIVNALAFEGKWKEDYRTTDIFGRSKYPGMIRMVIDSSDEEQSLNLDPQTLQIIAEETELDGRSMEILARYCNEEFVIPEKITDVGNGAFGNNLYKSKCLTKMVYRDKLRLVYRNKPFNFEERIQVWDNYL